jgi:hypothetical protein
LRSFQWKMLISISIQEKNQTKWLVLKIGKFTILVGNRNASKSDTSTTETNS